MLEGKQKLSRNFENIHYQSILLKRNFLTATLNFWIPL